MGRAASRAPQARRTASRSEATIAAVTAVTAVAGAAAERVAVAADTACSTRDAQSSAVTAVTPGSTRRVAVVRAAFAALATRSSATRQHAAIARITALAAERIAHRSVSGETGACVCGRTASAGAAVADNRRRTAPSPSTALWIAQS